MLSQSRLDKISEMENLLNEAESFLAEAEQFLDNRLASHHQNNSVLIFSF